MKIVEPVNRSNDRLRVGDVIVDKDGKGYLVIIQIGGRYTAKSFDGSSTLNGNHTSLEELNGSYFYSELNKECIIYNKEEYQLELNTKK